MYIQEKGIFHPKLRFFNNAPRPCVLSTSLEHILQENEAPSTHSIVDITAASGSMIMQNLEPVNDITTLEVIESQAILPMRQVPENLPIAK